MSNIDLERIKFACDNNLSLNQYAKEIRRMCDLVFVADELAATANAFTMKENAGMHWGVIDVCIKRSEKYLNMRDIQEYRKLSHNYHSDENSE